MADIDEVINGLEKLQEEISRTKSLWAEPTVQALDDAIELLKEQQAEIEYLKSEKTDAIEEIEREISVRERDPAYKTFSRGIVNGLEMALRIISEKGR